MCLRLCVVWMCPRAWQVARDGESSSRGLEWAPKGDREGQARWPQTEKGRYSAKLFKMYENMTSLCVTLWHIQVRFGMANQAKKSTASLDRDNWVARFAGNISRVRASPCSSVVAPSTQSDPRRSRDILLQGLYHSVSKCRGGGGVCVCTPFESLPNHYLRTQTGGFTPQILSPPWQFSKCNPEPKHLWLRGQLHHHYFSPNIHRHQFSLNVWMLLLALGASMAV